MRTCFRAATVYTLSPEFSTLLRASIEGLKVGPATSSQNGKAREADNQTKTGFNATRNPLQDAALSGDYRF
jgi:hypothetical protein